MDAKMDKEIEMTDDARSNQILRFSRLLGSAVKVNRQAHLYGYARSKTPIGSNAILEKLQSHAEIPFQANFLPPPPPEEVHDEVAALVPTDVYESVLPIEKPHSMAETPDGAFLPVHTMKWEEDIVYSSEEAKEALVKDYSDGKLPYCGWVPTANSLTHAAFMKLYKMSPPGEWFKAVPEDDGGEEEDANDSYPIDAHHSIFPPQNLDLDFANWEDDIIWDVADIQKPPEPKLLTIDLEDDPTIYGIPEDVPIKNVEAVKPAAKKKRPFTKKTSGLAQDPEDEELDDQDLLERALAQIAFRDPLYLSSDDYYASKIPPATSSTAPSSQQQNTVSSFEAVIQPPSNPPEDTPQQQRKPRPSQPSASSEERRLQKRREQDRLRRAQKSEAKRMAGPETKKPKAPPKEKPLKERSLKMRCSACGETGHMRTNRRCRLYPAKPEPAAPIDDPAIQESQEAAVVVNAKKEEAAVVNAKKEEPSPYVVKTEITEVEGTKLRIKKAALNLKPSLKLKFPKHILEQAKK